MIQSIKLSSLTMKNFMIYRDYEVKDLEQYKVVFISGSNAQGKSTLTSESIYYGLFGLPLRYKKISDLLNWYYDPDTNEEAYCTIGLSFNMGDHLTNLNISRNIIGDERYGLTVDNDTAGDFSYLNTLTKVKDINNEIKTLLDIDERKFSILYLKSPFSEVIFESDSDLLSSITKSQYINELRKDFNSVTNTLKVDKANLVNTIEKQNALVESINKQLKAILDKTDQEEDKKKLETIVASIAELELSFKNITGTITKTKADHRTYSDKKDEVYALVVKINSYIDQINKERDKYERLVERGKCPTCEQSISKTLYTNELKELNDKIKIYNNKLIENKDLLDKYKKYVNKLDNDLTEHQNTHSNINSKLRTLSNMKSELQTNINNFQDNKKNNDEVLKKIRNTIMDLNDDLTVLSKDYNIIDSVAKVMLSKNSEYINKFYNNKIHGFNLIFKSILSKMTKGKFTDVNIKLNNKPTLNGHIEYESLSTSERKFIDMSFVISYIVYLSTKLKLRTFILDEFLDNYDKKNVIHIYDMIYEIATTYDLQLFITTNMADYLFTYMGGKQDIKIIELLDQ